MSFVLWLMGLLFNETETTEIYTYCHTLSLHDALPIVARYIRLLGQIGRPEVTVKGDRVHLLWCWPYDSLAAPCIAQFMLGARAMFMRWLSDRADLRYDAHLHFPRPADVSAYEQVFGGTLRFSQPDSKMIFPARSEEHTSELQSLMRTSYAVFCLKKKKNTTNSQ